MELYSFYANHGLECALHPALCSAPTNLLPTIGSTWFLTTIPTPSLPIILAATGLHLELHAMRGTCFLAATDLVGSFTQRVEMFSSYDRFTLELHAMRGFMLAERSRERVPLGLSPHAPASSSAKPLAALYGSCEHRSCRGLPPTGPWPGVEAETRPSPLGP